MWLIGGGNRIPLNDVWHSTDGRVWIEATGHAAWPARTDAGAAAFDGKLWVFGGVLRNNVWTNDVWFSTDGRMWEKIPEQPPWSFRSGEFNVVFDRKLWLFGGRQREGFANDVWYMDRAAPAATDSGRGEARTGEDRRGQTRTDEDGRGRTRTVDVSDHPRLCSSSLAHPRPVHQRLTLPVSTCTNRGPG
jgi:hypothetical protein